MTSENSKKQTHLYQGADENKVLKSEFEYVILSSVYSTYITCKNGHTCQERFELT